MNAALPGDHALAMAGVTAGDWLAIGVGTALGIIATVVAIAIGRWQRLTQLGDRVQDRAERRAEERRLARRESRQHQYHDTHEALRLGQQIEWQVRNRGPFTDRGLDDLGLTKFVMELEQLAVRGPDRLREPLNRLAAAAKDLRKAAVTSPAARASVRVPEDETVLTAPITHADFRLAIQQDRAVQEMATKLDAAWSALTEEWGS